MVADTPPPLSDHLQQMIMFAWARSVGLDDSTLLDPDTGAIQPGRYEVSSTSDNTGSADLRIGTFIRLFSVSILYGPDWLIEAARDVDDEVLALESTLIRLSRDHGARSLGETTMYYAETMPVVEPSQTVAVAFEADLAQELESLCPCDDVRSVKLSSQDTVMTLVPDDGRGYPTGDPLAGGSYEKWQGLIGSISALVRPDVRRQGLGTYVSALAMEEALNAGLIPQWRAPMGHRASQRMADNLGFVLAGSQTTVLF